MVEVVRSLVAISRSWLRSARRRLSWPSFDAELLIVALVGFAWVFLTLLSVRDFVSFWMAQR